MVYEYKNLSYTKRGLTEDILIQVLEESYPEIIDKSQVYEEHAELTKTAELTGQQDACPVRGRKQLQPAMSYLREYYPGFRARNTQIGSAIYQERIEDVSTEDALYQIVNGTIVNFAEGYDEKAARTLLSKGILPLVVAKPPKTGSLIFIKGIRNALQQGLGKLEAYIFEGSLIPVDVSIGHYKAEELAAVLESEDKR